MSFFRDYADAYDFAVSQARKYNREMQLRAGVEYTTKGYYVSFAVGEGYRYGLDLRGEFIKPTDPRMQL